MIAPILSFDIDFINPLDNPGTLFAFQASSPEEAIINAPYALAVNSHWRPDQFKILSARISIYSKTEDPK